FLSRRGKRRRWRCSRSGVRRGWRRTVVAGTPTRAQAVFVRGVLVAWEDAPWLAARFDARCSPLRAGQATVGERAWIVEVDRNRVVIAGDLDLIPPGELRSRVRRRGRRRRHYCSRSRTFREVAVGGSEGVWLRRHGVRRSPPRLPVCSM